MGEGGQRHAPRVLPPEKRPGSHCIESCLCRKAGVVRRGEEKTSFPQCVLKNCQVRSESIQTTSFPPPTLFVTDQFFRHTNPCPS